MFFLHVSLEEIAVLITLCVVVYETNGEVLKLRPHNIKVST